MGVPPAYGGGSGCSSRSLRAKTGCLADARWASGDLTTSIDLYGAPRRASLDRLAFPKTSKEKVNVSRTRRISDPRQLPMRPRHWSTSRLFPRRSAHQPLYAWFGQIGSLWQTLWSGFKPALSICRDETPRCPEEERQSGDALSFSDPGSRASNGIVESCGVCCRGRPQHAFLFGPCRGSERRRHSAGSLRGASQYNEKRPNAGSDRSFCAIAAGYSPQLRHSRDGPAVGRPGVGRPKRGAAYSTDR